MKLVERKESIIELSELPEEFIVSYLAGFITLFSTGMNCESSLLVYFLKIYNKQPIIINDGFFRDQFRIFCEHNGGKPFTDPTIKKALRSLLALKLIEQPEYKKYRLHSKFFYIIKDEKN